MSTLAGRRRHLPAINKAIPQGGGWGWMMGAYAEVAQVGGSSTAEPAWQAEGGGDRDGI